MKDIACHTSYLERQKSLEPLLLILLPPRNSAATVPCGMDSHRHHLDSVAIAALVIAQFAAAVWATPSVGEKGRGGNLRWAEGGPGCTLTRGDDGKSYYALSADDVRLVVTVDSQELQLVRRRIKPIFAVGLTVRYQGSGTVEVTPKKLSLEFETHSHVVQQSLDPYALAVRLRTDSAMLEGETTRDIQKHPEKREARLRFLQQYQNDSADMVNFLNTYALRRVQLNSAEPEVSGWVFFSTDNKWIGKWKKKEQFLLRVPLENHVYEFPFALPEELTLRRRQP